MKYENIISFLEDFELNYIYSIINNNSILSKLVDTENIDEDFINMFL